MKRRIQLEFVKGKKSEVVKFLKRRWPRLNFFFDGDTEVIIKTSDNKKVIEDVWSSLQIADPKWLDTGHYYRDEKEFCVEFMCGRKGTNREDLSKLPPLSSTPAQIWGLYDK